VLRILNIKHCVVSRLQDSLFNVLSSKLYKGKLTTAAPWRPLSPALNSAPIPKTAQCDIMKPRIHMSMFSTFNPSPR
jgi:hypothetical protein